MKELMILPCYIFQHFGPVGFAVQDSLEKSLNGTDGSFKFMRYVFSNLLLHQLSFGRFCNILDDDLEASILEYDAFHSIVFPVFDGGHLIRRMLCCSGCSNGKGKAGPKGPAFKFCR